VRPGAQEDGAGGRVRFTGWPARRSLAGDHDARTGPGRQLRRVGEATAVMCAEPPALLSSVRPSDVSRTVLFKQKLTIDASFDTVEVSVASKSPAAMPLHLPTPTREAKMRSMHS
jgi:hypothetical protein